MLYIHLTVLGVLGFSTVNASNENLLSKDNPERMSSATSVTLQSLNPNNSNLTLQHLRHSRHQIRMSLMNSRRTPSIAPPEGERRHQLELRLAEIEHILTQKP